jgi:protein O-GlcNAc transferase
MGLRSDAKELFYRGCSLLDAGEPAQAIKHLSNAAALAPDSTAIMERLAEAYHFSGQLLPALKTYDRIIERGAANQATWCATGNALSDAGEHAQAIGAYEHGLELNGTNPEVHHNLARAHYRLGNLSGAINHLETAAAQCESIDPWLSLATIIPGWPDATHEKILDVRRTFAARLKAHAPTPPSHRGRRRMSDKSRLRIGYMSAFFDQANYMKPVWGLINNHDRESFDIHLFSDCPLSHAGGYNGHPRDRMHETAKLDNGAIAELILSSGIDILVDLNAYSVPDRLPLFAQRLAPVTIAWFNMYATSGLPGIDYIVGDRDVIRTQEEAFYSETVLRLPVSYLTFKVTHAAPPVVEPPCRRDPGFVFGSLVAQYKVTAPVISAWAEILNRVPGTRLLLANAQLRSPQNCGWVQQQFSDRGVAPDRLILLPPADHYAYLKYYNSIDIALDAFPYNGGTTTMEALWQGVPVLTFDGDRWASRTSQSLIRNTHLGEFVTHDIRSYVETAIALAKDPSTPRRLLELRNNMRRNLEKASACDTHALACSMQRLYQNVWRNQVSTE